MLKKILCVIGLTLVFAGLTFADAQWKDANYVSTAGAWEDATHWNTSPSRLPNDTDSLVKLYRSDQTGSNITISTSVSGGIKVQMRYGQSKLTINNGGTLTNLGTVEMFASTRTESSEVQILSGGTWNACKTVSGALFNMSTGNNGSKDTLSVSGTLNVDGTANPILTIGTTTNVNGYGTVNIYNGGLVYTDRYTIGSRGIIKIWSGGVFKINGNVTSQTTVDLGTKIVGQDGAILSTYFVDADNATYVTTPQQPSSLVINGYVKDGSNAAIESVTLDLSDGNSAVTDVNGFYQVQVASGWSGTITPAKSGYSFSPDSISYSNVSADHTGQNYTGTLLTYTISGNTGIAGVALDGFPGETVTSDDSGNYTATVDYGWSGTVAPSKEGYSFSPESREYSNVTSNQTGQDYTTTLLTYTISGNTGVGAVALDGFPGGTVTSDGIGNYTTTVDYGWSGTVTPNKAGYTFTPASRTYSNVTADQTSQDYTGTLLTYTISGNTGVGSVSLAGFPGGTVTSDGSGDYTATVDYGWSGSVTPSKGGYTFEPASRTYTNVTSDQFSQDYTPASVNILINGYIKNACNVPIQSVSVDAGGGNTTVTAADGFYQLQVAYNWSGTVNVSKSLYTFTPADRSYSSVIANQTAQNYLAENIYDLDCDGLIGWDDVSVIAANWLNQTPGNVCDFNSDEKVNFYDFAEFANIWKTHH